MKYCGLDLGKKSSHFCIVDDGRRILREGRARTNEKGLRKVFGKCGRMRVVLEATLKAFWIADMLEKCGHEVHVVDPGRTKAIGSTLIKHDKLDARVLAVLAQANLLATVDRPSAEQRVERTSVNVRDGLVKSRTRLVNMVRSLLESEGVTVPACGTASFVEVVRGLDEKMPTGLAENMEPGLRAIEELSKSIGECDRKIAAAAKEDPVVELLMSAVGVGPITATVFVQVVRDPARFRSARQVGAYLGLVPSLYSSGKTHRLGRITKRGNRALRWLLTMAANALLRARKPSRLRNWGLALAERVGRKKAIVAIARKLAGVLWAMWRSGTRFEVQLGQSKVYELEA